MQVQLMPRRVVLRALGVSCVTWPLGARAQGNWPERDLRIVVGTQAGGISDLYSRAVAEHCRAELGRAVIVDNRPGAGGLIGARAVAQAPADGYTIAYVNSGLVTIQAMGQRLDLLKELRMVARVAHFPFALAVRADSPYHSAADLVAAVKANPGKLTYGSAGIGSPAHLAVEMLEDRVPGFKALHVPFKGGSESAAAVIGGQVDFSLSVLGSLMPLAQGGKLRLLAVTSERRADPLPQVPTFSESAAPGFVYEAWLGFAVPAGTPDAIVDRLARAFKAAAESAPVRALQQRGGGVTQFMDGPTLAAQIARDLPAETSLVKRLGMPAGQ